MAYGMKSNLRVIGTSLDPHISAGARLDKLIAHEFRRVDEGLRS